ncbi:type I restriction endonuclease subunit R [Mycoplasma mycoides]|uniref:type I restriction endonuclease subunit R n=1 Tax=Mycoplasma mycoides TaxID=2102 RepID=UPI00044D324F|nr:HsdR family type I site-specific deoxyribonuclease [Mycoplasma mycoides]EXU60778.1 Type I restriction modification system endonuclease (R) subunit, HsdR [Mycoplasma mycoides subsp. capri PG3]QVK04507.1 type I restriction endonuclease subunit R [Mycoplasma mycoides subsp. capri]
MHFISEKDFEKTIINNLKEYGWKGFPNNLDDHLTKQNNYKVVLTNPDERQLIQNWKNIIFSNNKDILNGIELSSDEMDQIIQLVNNCKSFVDSNTLISNEFITIKRTNKDDQKSFNKEVALRLINKRDINSGYTTYQIAQQIRTDKLEDSKSRRGDLMLLINGMPLIHIELKNNTQSIGNAVAQLHNYSRLGFYNGIFKLVQVIVAMTPNEMMYMPNAVDHKDISKERFLKWTDENNKPINDWKTIVKQFFRIPFAHRLIADFAIADSSDNNLKLLRSYQIHAVNKIQNKFFNKEIFIEKLSKISQKGGYVWHTTGSGKTLTSFKLSTLLLEWNQADTVVFVVDRIELGTQTKSAFKNFNSSGKISVLEAESTNDLVELLSDNSSRHQLIITSIHKQSRANQENYEKQLQQISKKKIVFIFDEAHRSTFGDMFKNIITSIPNSVVFGFTGTPIFKENKKEDRTTEDNFGPLLHKYTMDDGMNDGKVLGFTSEYVYLDRLLLPTIDQYDNRSSLNNNPTEIAFEKLQKLQNLIKEKDEHLLKYEKNLYKFLQSDKNNNYKEQVVDDILKKWRNKSWNNFFSAIFATSSIKDAIDYFEIFSKKVNDKKVQIKFTALFDPSTDISEEYDNISKGLLKSEKIKEIIYQYNNDFNTNFDASSTNDYANFKIDIQKRLARKDKYTNLDNKENKDQRLDLLIVVNQLLTGYDSKYINTVYFDKKLEDEHLIQAISRTNRIYKKEKKPLGDVVFYNRPGQMRWNVDKALVLYTNTNPEMGAPMSLELLYSKIDESFTKIKCLFEQWNYPNFESVPNSEQIKKDDAKLFLSEYQNIRTNLRTAIILGFDFDNNKKIIMTKDQWELIESRIKDIDFSQFKDSIQEDDELFLILELADVENTSWTFVIDNNYLKKLFNDYNYKKENKEITEEYRIWFKKELENKFIIKFPKEYQQIARGCLDSLIGGLNKNVSEFDLKDEVIRRVRNKIYQEISDFSGAMNLNTEELKKIIDSDDPINAYGRFEDLCKNGLTEQAKSAIARYLDTSIEEIKPGPYKKEIKAFIKEQKKKRMKI